MSAARKIHAAVGKILPFNVNKEKIMKKISIAVLLSTAVISSAAFADASGFFGAIDAQNWSESGPANITNPSTGYRIGGGYNFTQNWGVEVDYAKSGDATLPANQGGGL